MGRIRRFVSVCLMAGLFSGMAWAQPVTPLSDDEQTSVLKVQQRYTLGPNDRPRDARQLTLFQARRSASHYLAEQEMIQTAPSLPAAQWHTLIAAYLETVASEDQHSVDWEGMDQLELSARLRIAKPTLQAALSQVQGDAAAQQQLQATTRTQRHLQLQLRDLQAQIHQWHGEQKAELKDLRQQRLALLKQLERERQQLRQQLNATRLPASPEASAQ
ncbi:hypothetical protein [Ferrimonas marina]|uniref:Uncharacterized protein n=1 Tax=Ferrimonas marina TaxID=299255 RepID=A0A1M5YC40_9GAMM|nr:hypothetical protein [Ferrimonas marina]SHI09408.1 hypothetical protein SAMN02745129_4051 [Ferrimonas marina]